MRQTRSMTNKSLSSSTIIATGLVSSSSSTQQMTVTASPPSNSIAPKKPLKALGRVLNDS